MLSNGVTECLRVTDVPDAYAIVLNRNAKGVC